MKDHLISDQIYTVSFLKRISIYNHVSSFSTIFSSKLKSDSSALAVPLVTKSLDYFSCNQVLRITSATTGR